MDSLSNDAAQQARLTGHPLWSATLQRCICAKLLAMHGVVLDWEGLASDATELWQEALATSAMSVPWVIDRLIGTYRLDRGTEWDIIDGSLEKHPHLWRPLKTLSEQSPGLLANAAGGISSISSEEDDPSTWSLYVGTSCMHLLQS